MLNFWFSPSITGSQTKWFVYKCENWTARERVSENICIFHLSRSVASLNSMNRTKVFAWSLSVDFFSFSLLPSVYSLLYFVTEIKLLLKCKLIRYLRILYRKLWIIYFAYFSWRNLSSNSFLFFLSFSRLCVQCKRYYSDIIIGLNCYDIIMYRANNNPLRFICVLLIILVYTL